MFENSSPDVTENDNEDFDALYDSIMEPNGDGPSVEAQPEKVQAPVESTQAQAEPEHEYTWNGQKIKAPLSEILKKAGMGHDYAQKMQEHNRSVNEWKEKLTLSEQLEEKYGSVDQWVRTNPDKWEKLQAIIQAEKAGHSDLDVNNPLFQELQSLKRQLNEQILPTIQETQQEKTRLQYEAEDKALASEIQSIQEKYKDLDWATKDEHGMSLEMRVLKHAAANGFKTFKSAFLDINHDDLMKRAEERGKTSIANERAKQVKSGLLGKTSAPTQGMQKATNIKQKSYADLTKEALDELGISK